MDTTVKFDADVSKVRSGIEEIGQLQRSASEEEMSRDIQIARQKTGNERETISYLKEQLQIKEADLLLEKESSDQIAKDRRDQNRNELGGAAKITIRDSNKIDASYKEDLQSSREEYAVHKENLEIQKAMLRKMDSEEKIERIENGDGGGGKGIMSSLTNFIGGGSGGGSLVSSIGKAGIIGALVAAVVGYADKIYTTVIENEIAGISQEQKDINIWKATTGLVPVQKQELMLAQKRLDTRKAWGGDAGLTRGLTGRSAPMFGWASELGFDSQQLQASYRMLTGEIGREDDPLFKDVTSTTSAYSLTKNQPLLLAGMNRMDKTGVGRALGFITQAETEGNLSRPQVGEITDAVLSLSQAQRESINPDLGINSQLALRLHTIGGAFGDDRLGGIMGKMNQAAISPQSDALKALQFQLIAELPSMQGKNYADMRVAMSEGISHPGVAKAMMEEAVSAGGGDESLTRGNLEGLFNISPQQAKTLYSAYKKNPSLFDSITGEKSSEEVLKMAGIRSKEGIEATPDLKKEEAAEREKWFKEMDNNTSATLANTMALLGKKTETTPMPTSLDLDKPDEVSTNITQYGSNWMKVF